MTDFEEKYLARVKSIILKHIDKNKFHVFLFGSRARATYPDRTDIDVGIWGDMPLRDYDPRAWQALLDELDEAWIPFDLDLVDFCHAQPYFKQAALENYIVWNTANSVANWQPSAAPSMAGKH